MQALKTWFYGLFQSGFTREVSHGTIGDQSKLGTSTTIPSTNAPNNIVESINSSEFSGFNQQISANNEFLGDYDQLPAFIEELYIEWIARKSGKCESEDSSFENKLLEYLDVLAESELAGSNLIPRVPSVMVELLKRMHEENISGLELSRIIAKDVVLVTALLGEVNSSFYSPLEKINDLSQAILILGHNRLRLVLAKISFTPIYNSQLGAYTKTTASKIWDESQKRALMCFLLAKSQNVDPFMAFLAGLMQDVGLMAALRVFDRSGGNGQLPTSMVFRQELLQRALVLSTRIGRIWLLPEHVTKAIEFQCDTKAENQFDASEERLAMLLKKGDFLSKICILVDAGQLVLDMEKLKSILTCMEMDYLCTLLEGNVTVSSIF